jgi:hypothetical protein
MLKYKCVKSPVVVHNVNMCFSSFRRHNVLANKTMFTYSFCSDMLYFYLFRLLLIHHQECYMS